MPNVEIRTTYVSKYSNLTAVEVRLDDEVIADGYFGGEPEDNTRSRDYAWVDAALRKLAERLGARVEFTTKLENEET